MTYEVFTWYPYDPFTFTKSVGVFFISFNRLSVDPPPTVGLIWPRGR